MNAIHTHEIGDKASERQAFPAIPELTLPAYVLSQASQRGSKRRWSMRRMARR